MVFMLLIEGMVVDMMVIYNFTDRVTERFLLCVACRAGIIIGIHQ